jgi:transposase InsO family protein
LPVPPRYPRQRALTISENDPAIVGHSQSQSAFFAKLPLEIRRQIYIQVLGKWSLILGYIFNWDGRHRAYLCTKIHMHSSRSEGPEIVYSGKREDVGVHCCNGLMPLLKTCRRLYVCLAEV